MALSDMYTKATRITAKLLKQCAQHPPEELEYLDLSQRGITVIECLDTCPRLQFLVLCSNSINAISNVEVCRHLWRIDLTGNRVKSIDGLCRFPAFGTLELGFNELEWSAVERLSHVTILNLTLLGNAALDSDPNYRRHVIDLLPHLWMLDGKLITANERQQVTKFFTSSQFSSQPVRRKVNDSVFTPSSQKNLMVNGVFGDKTVRLMLKFPVSYTHNVEMDKRRLLHLAAAFDEELVLQSMSAPPLEGIRLANLMESRHKAIQQCNMVLLLLAAYHEYGLPLDVMQATLETTKLANICDMNTVGLFRLPPQVALQIMSLLYSAASVDREEKQEGGLYLKLYESLSQALDDLNRKVTSCKAKREVKSKKMKESKAAQLKSLLSCEVLHLLCLVPQFFESIEANKGTQRIITAATRSNRTLDNIGCIRWKVEANKGNTMELYHEIASYLMQSISEDIGLKGTRSLVSTDHTTPPPALQHTLSAEPFAQRSYSAGSLKPARMPGSTSSHGNKKLDVGDIVMVSPETFARIVALPQSDIAVLQMTTTLASSEPYFVTDTRRLVWDRAGYWVKRGLTTSTVVQSSSSQPCMLHPSSPSSSPLGRQRSPDPTSTPCSQLTITSEDLRRIHSEESLLEEEPSHTHMPTAPPMKVDIRHSIRSLVCDHLVAQEKLDQIENIHRRHTLQGAQEMEMTSAQEEEEPAGPDHTLTISAPRMQTPTMWDSTRSCPAPHSKVHSCHHQEAMRQMKAMDPPLAPTPPTSPVHLPSSTSTMALQPPPRKASPTHSQQPVVYQAWTVVKPGPTPTRNTLLTSARLMNKRQPTHQSSLRRHSAPSKPTRSEEGSTSTSTVILQQRQSRPATPKPPPPTRQGQYHFGGVRPSSRASSARKLGQTRSVLTAGGTSVF